MMNFLLCYHCRERPHLPGDPFCSMRCQDAAEAIEQDLLRTRQGAYSLFGMKTGRTRSDRPNKANLRVVPRNEDSND